MAQLAKPQSGQDGIRNAILLSDQLSPMKKNLIKILGLESDATDADIYARIGELKALSHEMSDKAITVSTPQLQDIHFFHTGDSLFHTGDFPQHPWM